MTIRYTAGADSDLANIKRYYAESAGADVAEALTSRIVVTLERLVSHHPRAGRARPEFGSGVRSFPVLPYVVFYRAEGNRIYVIRVLHGRRNIQRPLASLLLAM
jgi:toxin ParE1/3/4